MIKENTARKALCVNCETADLLSSDIGRSMVLEKKKGGGGGGVYVLGGTGEREREREREGREREREREREGVRWKGRQGVGLSETRCC